MTPAELFRERHCADCLPRCPSCNGVTGHKDVCAHVCAHTYQQYAPRASASFIAETTKGVDDMKRIIEVVEIKTGAVVHRLDVTGKSETQIERVERGLMQKVDTERFFTREAT